MYAYTWMHIYIYIYSHMYACMHRKVIMMHPSIKTHIDISTYKYRIVMHAHRKLHMHQIYTKTCVLEIANDSAYVCIHAIVSVCMHTHSYIFMYCIIPAASENTKKVTINVQIHMYVLTYMTYMHTYVHTCVLSAHIHQYIHKHTLTFMLNLVLLHIKQSASSQMIISIHINVLQHTCSV